MRKNRLILFAGISVLLLFAQTVVTATELPDFLDEYRDKVVVVDFWASWCVPCRRSFPWLNEMQQKYAADGLVVIGVNEDNDQSEATAFLDKYPPNFRIIPDPDGHLASQFDLYAMPTSFLIGRNGEQISNHLGFKVAKIDEYESLLRQALGLDINDAAVGH